VEIYTGFAVDEMLYEEGKVAGVKTKDTGVDHHGAKQKNYQEGTIVKASITILAEGTRGSLAKKVIDRYDLKGKNPQIYSLGAKEIWSVPEGNIAPGAVYHTFGYVLCNDYLSFLAVTLTFSACTNISNDVRVSLFLWLTFRCSRG